MRNEPILNHVYYLKDYTAPKVFLGTHFECLLTDQKIGKDARVVKHIRALSEWISPIYKPERFTK